MKKILCVCIGNSDRSPAMAAILQMFLAKAGHEVVCESVGVGENAGKGGPAAPFAIAAAKRIGIDLSSHRKRRITEVDVSEYDLIVCATDQVAGEAIMTHGVDIAKVYTAGIPNNWPFKFQVDYDLAFESILGAMYRVIARYFSD